MADSKSHSVSMTDLEEFFKSYPSDSEDKKLQNIYTLGNVNNESNVVKLPSTSHLNEHDEIIETNADLGSSQSGLSQQRILRETIDTTCEDIKKDIKDIFDKNQPKIVNNSISNMNCEDDDEYVGFATLPDQVHRKAVKRGFDFTLMVVGESGLGKSTLINSLFLTELYGDRVVGSVTDRFEKTVEIEKKQLEIEEKGVRLRLTIVDTPGYNDAVNGDSGVKSLVEYVDKQFEQYYSDENGLNRRHIVDNRVHCCLYFISPYGHGLKPIDIFMMKQLHHKVNIVPIIAKSDILTKPEVERFKHKILEEIENHSIQIYEFPDCDSDEDEDFKEQDDLLKAAVPFAVVGCNTVVEAGGKKIRGRAYPWGIVEIDNPSHCDFGRLRQMLISTHMQDLKDVTSDIHYENYRAEHIQNQIGTTQRERSKLKRDSMMDVTDESTEKLLQQKEAEIQRMQAMLAKMQQQLGHNNSVTSATKPMNGLVKTESVV